MLYKFFSAIKTRLIADMPELTGGVEWFNNQYDAIIPVTPLCFVEFPLPIEPGQVDKDMTRATITARLHVASKVITQVENTVPDQAVIEHEAIAVKARDIVRNEQFTDSNGVPITTRMRWVKWQHYHNYRGWMVTTIDFEFK